MTLDSRQLRLRWTTEEGAVLANEVLSRLVAGSSLTGLPLDRIDGRLDLRGIVAPKPRASAPASYIVRTPDGVEFSQHWITLDGLQKINGTELTGLDFSAADLAHLRFTSVRIGDCVFDAANCKDWRLWDSEIVDCRFIAADLDDLSVGAAHNGKPNRLMRLDFTRAKLSGSRTRNWGIAQVTDCDFSFAHLADINFFQAELIRCTFAGTLKRVIFDGRVLRPADKLAPNPIEDVDLSRVTAFEDVSFRGVHFDRIQLPQDPNLIVIRDDRWSAFVLEVLADRDDLVARVAKVFAEDAEKFNRGAHSFINMNRTDDQTDEEAFRLLRDLLKEFAASTHAR
jgi:uncharacterized protein YjbI with pentapeptide repeats